MRGAVTSGPSFHKRLPRKGTRKGLIYFLSGAAMISTVGYRLLNMVETGSSKWLRARIFLKIS